MSRILDPSFRYLPSAQTDIRKTFARIRREIAARTAAEKAAPKVRQISEKKAGKA